MKKLSLLIALLTLMSVVMFAQAPAGSISGTITNGGDQKIIDAATVSLFKYSDSSLVKISLADKEGYFVPEMLILENDYSLHILNYNSPGATGALPVGAKIVSGLLEKGCLHKSSEKGESLWDISEILE